MALVFGFSGPPDATTETAMQTALEHRCGPYAQVHRGREFTLGWGSQSESGGSFAVHEQAALAIAGQVTTDPRPPALQADEAGIAAWLLARYREAGASVLEGLEGAYVLALIDGGTVYLVRDGAGQQTIYWSDQGGEFRFAIEPKGIWSSPGWSRRLHAPAIARYLAFSFQPGRETMLEGLYELPPGTRLTRGSTGDVHESRWFCFEEEAARAHTERPDSAWEAAFAQELEFGIRTRLPAAPERVGATLSGGIDSSVVVAELCRLRPARSVQTFSLHFGRKYPHELDPARSVAERCGTTHHEIEITPRAFVQDLRKIIWHLDDPIGDPVTVPNYLVARAARREVRTLFNGEGGDPLFGGPKNLPMMLAHWYGGIERESGWRERRYIASFARAYAEIDALLLPEWRRRIDIHQHLEAPLTPFFAATVPNTMLGKLQAMNIRLKGAHLILPKVDRMQRAHGITPASPLFTERMIRLSQTMPAHLRLAHGIEKVVLKRCFADRLPREVIDRKKSGMRVPVRYWMRGEMARYARKILAPRAVRQAGLFRPERVRSLLRYDTEDLHGRHGLRLWMILSLEIWRRLVIDNEAL